MRVLLTTPYDLAVPGGVNRHARDLLDALTQRGVEAKLLGPASQPVLTEDPRIVRLGRVWVGALNGARSRVTLDLRIGAAVRACVREFKPDVVHAQEPFLPVLNTFALLQAGRARRVGTFHTFSETSRGYLWVWPWCRWVAAQLDARIAVSRAARDFAARYHPGDYAIVPNGIRPAALAAGRASRTMGVPVRLLFVGRTDEPRKGFAVLRAAWEQLQLRQPGKFALSVVGPGERDPGLRDVAWRGELTDAELAAAYAGADFAIVPSIGGESFGLVALEALARGVPVIASRIRGYVEWLDRGGAAELVPPGDATALADAIVALAREPGRHATMVQQARAVAADYDWARLVDRVLSVYTAGSSNELGRG